MKPSSLRVSGLRVSGFLPALACSEGALRVEIDVVSLAQDLRVAEFAGRRIAGHGANTQALSDRREHEGAGLP
jgi:hypothetical protein